MTSLARWLSIVAHPFVTIGLLVGTVTARVGTPGEAARSLVIVALFTICPLLVLMVRQVRRGIWENVDASNRRERPVLFLVGGVATIALVLYLLLARTQPALLHGSIGVCGMFAGCAVATRWVKVSLHMAFATLAATALTLTGSRVGWALWLVVPALAWARLTLGRHSAVEVTLGTAIGIAAGAAIYLA